MPPVFAAKLAFVPPLANGTMAVPVIVPLNVAAPEVVKATVDMAVSAVIVAPLKSPEASRATIVDAVLADAVVMLQNCL